MLPPPIQPMPKLNFKNEKSSNRPIGVHKKWQDTASAESNVRPTIVLPNASQYDSKLNSNADDVNQLLSHSPMKSKKSWLQDLLQKEVTRPALAQSNVQTETLTMLKLNVTNHYSTKMPEVTTPHFVPTIQPMIGNDDRFSFEETPTAIMQPMNLIIQGHSRVKTYGQGTEQRNPKIIEVKSAENPVVNRVVSQDENGVRFDVKHLHVSDRNKTQDSLVNTTADAGSVPLAGLLSLLDLSFGDFLDNVTMPEVANKTNEIKNL